MASILDKFGIKEVGDVTFYKLNTSGQPTYPVLFLDTCKTTSLEQSADEVEAKGGKGNVSLMVWDTNKQLTVSLEDALFSAKSMAIMFGDGTAADYSTGSGTGTSAKYIMKSETFTSAALSGGALPGEAASAEAATTISGWDQGFSAPDGKRWIKKNPKFFDENGAVVVASSPASGQVAWEADKTYFCSYDLVIAGAVITINKDSFPGSYYVTMDTYARMQGSGEDDFFQLIMPNCKVESSNTITMSADGDPSTLTMNLKVQKPVSGPMVYMVKYGLAGTSAAASESTLQIPHNHVLNGTNG